MPLTVRKFNAQVKDPQSGQMVPAGLLSSDSLQAIEAAESSAITAIQQKGAETKASIPDDYTELSDSVDELKTQINELGYQVGSIAVIGGQAHNLGNKYKISLKNGKTYKFSIVGGNFSSTFTFRLYGYETINSQGTIIANTLSVKADTPKEFECNGDYEYIDFYWNTSWNVASGTVKFRIDSTESIFAEIDKTNSDIDDIKNDVNNAENDIALLETATEQTESNVTEVTGQLNTLGYKSGLLSVVSGTAHSEDNDQISVDITDGTSYIISFIPITYPENSNYNIKLYGFDANGNKTQIGGNLTTLTAKSVFKFTAEDDFVKIGVYWGASWNPNAGILLFIVEEEYSIYNIIRNSKNYVNIKTFGARGNETTNDFAAITAAIESMNEGDTLYIPNGTYLTNDTITISKNINVYCDGIITSNQMAKPTITLDGLSHCNIYIKSIMEKTLHLDFVDNAVETYNTGIKIRNCNYCDITIKHVYGFNTGILLVSAGANGCHYNKIHLNQIETCFNGIRLLQPTGGDWINANEFDGAVFDFHTWNNDDNNKPYCIMTSAFTGEGYTAPYNMNANIFMHMIVESGVSNNKYTRLIKAPRMYNFVFEFDRIEINLNKVVDGQTVQDEIADAFSFGNMVKNNIININYSSRKIIFDNVNIDGNIVNQKNVYNVGSGTESDQLVFGKKVLTLNVDGTVTWSEIT